jgi:hypothetical protein
VRGRGCRQGFRDPPDLLEVAPPERANTRDQLAPEFRRHSHFAVGLGLADIVGRAELQRLDADLRVPPRHRRGNNDGEIRLLREQERERLQTVEHRHLDVEHNEVGVDAREILHRLEPVAVRADDLDIRLFGDPARDEAAEDDGVVDHHHPDLGLGRVNLRDGCLRHELNSNATRYFERRARGAPPIRSGRLHAASLRRSPCRRAS